MNQSYARFGGLSAMIVGALSILYAIFFLVITPRAEAVGALGSWIILAVSGIFSSAAFVALYLRLRPSSEGFALWGLVLGLFSSFATLAHGAWQALAVSYTHLDVYKRQSPILPRNGRRWRPRSRRLRLLLPPVPSLSD